MANYLEQIPKQLAARRKAFNAAKSNPALLPSCWAIVRSIANNMYDYARNAAIGGCTFPDRPMYLSEDDAAFLNFGTTPTLLKTDTAWREAEEAGTSPTSASPDDLSPERLRIVRQQLSSVAATFATNHAATRVYNLEPWLQEMYRDRLDVDFAEDLQRQIDALNAYMDSVPKSVAATGLNARMSKAVMDAFTLFKTITGSSHQLDREKSSFVDRRSYVNTIQKIELIMQKADETLGSAVAGRSVVREMFSLWKDANYEMMALTRQLRVLWAGTSLDDRIEELAELLAAIQSAINRCSEESVHPTPQLPVFLGDGETPAPLSRSEITEMFREIILYDMVASSQATLQVREIRKYGPLAVVITPGRGDPRYCSEIRKLGADEDDPRKRKETKVERDVDVDRRIRYPLNCLVVPLSGNRETLPEKMADAWLEYNQAAFPVQFKEFLEAAKAAAPAVFTPPEDKDAKTIPPTFARQMLGRLVAAFARWAHSGEEPDAEALPGFEAFRDVVLSRLRDDAFLIPTRYRPFIELFAEAGPKRRAEMWKRNLGLRYGLDRQLVAASILMKDWDAVEENLHLLSLEVTKSNSNLENARAKVKDTGDPFGEHKAIAFFRKFLTEAPDLKSALVTVESQTAIEVETLRTQSESLGKVFQYDQASETMMRRQLSQIQEKRMAANAHIDHHLIGLMYAVSGNLVAAESALSMCLVPREKQQPDDCPPPPAPEEIDDEWFRENLKPKDGKFPKRDVAGETAPGTASYELVYYNLGLVYLKLQKYTEARMCFKALLDESPADKSFLYRQWAEKHMEAAKEKSAPAEAAAK
ncbi:MAG: tetratricopeptide repeat protein [Planctomycetaceae bacterium]|nr:tetratricopeptide repeat protein [Planctomycetaceae bacterium]